MVNAVMQIWLSTMTMMLKLLQMATAPTMVTDLQEKMEPVEAMVMLPRKIPWVPLRQDPLRPHLLGERRTIKHQALLELEKSYHQFPNQHWEPWVIITFSSKETFWLGEELLIAKPLIFSEYGLLCANCIAAAAGNLTWTIHFVNMHFSTPLCIFGKPFPFFFRLQ